jgi:hypothetical protein
VSVKSQTKRQVKEKNVIRDSCLVIRIAQKTKKDQEILPPWRGGNVRMGMNPLLMFRGRVPGPWPIMMKGLTKIKKKKEERGNPPIPESKKDSGFRK